MRISFLIIALAFGSIATAQGTNMEYENIDISPPPLFFIHADMDLIPGTNTYAVSATQSFPMYIIDSETLEIKDQYDVGNWYGGSRINPSPSGKYLLLQQLKYMDYAPNKDREVHFEVIETATGKTVLDIPSAHSASIHPNENALIVLIGDDVYSYPLDGKEKRKLFPVPEATNCVAISPDGKQIAISHHVEDDYLNDYVTKKGQKKNYKIFKDYRQCVSVYSTEDYKRLYTVDEMFDIPYILQYDPTGTHLLCYSVPHTKVIAKTGMQGTKYISKINSVDGKYTGVGFVSNSNFEPDIEFSNDGSKIAIVTNGAKFSEIWICDYESGDILLRFQNAVTFFEGVNLKTAPGDAGRIGLAFSPDDSHLLFTNGAKITKWKLNYED